MDITKLIISAPENLTADVEFREGLILQLRFVSRTQLQSLYKSCTVMKFDPQLKIRKQQLDGEKFAAEFCKLAVAGWRGVTPNSLSKIVPMDLSSLSAEDREKEIPFTQEGIAAIVKAAYELDAFIQDNAVDVAIFSPDHQDEVKNSSTSQSGS